MQYDTNWTDRFVQSSTAILAGTLTGIYLHGSAAMGCWNPGKSDFDLLLVVRTAPSDAVKRIFLDMVVAATCDAPAKGVELSIIREDVCNPFVYPTPFELHYSIAHDAACRADPQTYIRTMRGTDRDLAAHITVLRRRGIVLYGAPIASVFAPVNDAYYFDSILRDVENARAEIQQAPMDVTLNLCRVLAYRQDRVVLSKQEGGLWGLAHLPQKYHRLIVTALEAYQSDKTMSADGLPAEEYAADLLSRIGRR